ncbi:MAG: hypothetical protein J5685_10930 [Clostridiales bacterium]|nr:hypothetical protein [Clostridiales bacterium]
MNGYGRYRDTNMEVHNFLQAERSLERARESVRQVGDMGATIRKMDIILCSMFELLKEKGVTEDELKNKIVEVVSDKRSFVEGRASGECPKCKKKVVESPKTPFQGQCLYCGNVLNLMPDFSGKSAEATDEDAGNGGTEVTGAEVPLNDLFN